MKEFALYTALRLGLFVLCYIVFAGIWMLTIDDGGSGYLVPFVAAVIVSAVLSLKLLKPHRERFAAVVQQRAERASQRFEDMKAREDSED